MLSSGLDLDGTHLALVCASHNAEPGHLAVVDAILSAAGLTAAHLRNTPDWPLDAEPPRSAAPPATGPRRSRRTAPASTPGCSRPVSPPAGRPTATSTVHAPAAARPPRRGRRADGRPRRARHRRRVRGAAVLDDAGRSRAVVRALVARVASGPAARVARAMAANPWHVAGTGRDATRFMEAVPGWSPRTAPTACTPLGCPTGGARVQDRRRVVAPASRGARRRAGRGRVDVGDLGATPVLGHGAPVGAVTAHLRAGVLRRATVRAVVQRVTRASVTWTGSSSARSTGPGSWRSSGSRPGDGPAQVELIARKIAELRILRDEAARWTSARRCSSSASSRCTPTPARAAARRGTPRRPARSLSRWSGGGGRPARSRARGGDGALRRGHGGRAGQRRADDDPAGVDPRLTRAPREPRVASPAATASLTCWSRHAQRSLRRPRSPREAPGTARLLAVRARRRGRARGTSRAAQQRECCNEASNHHAPRAGGGGPGMTKAPRSKRPRGLRVTAGHVSPARPATSAALTVRLGPTPSDPASRSAAGGSTAVDLLVRNAPAASSAGRAGFPTRSGRPFSGRPVLTAPVPAGRPAPRGAPSVLRFSIRRGRCVISSPAVQAAARASGGLSLSTVYSTGTSTG